MLTIKYGPLFKKDYKRIIKRGYDIRLLEEVISLLIDEKPLPEKYRNHKLKGKKYVGSQECHITPDWLLVYRVEGGQLFLRLMRTGTHSDLF